jgi:hypothetical protein
VVSYTRLRNCTEGDELAVKDHHKHPSAGGNYPLRRDV